MIYKTKFLAEYCSFYGNVFKNFQCKMVHSVDLSVEQI